MNEKSESRAFAFVIITVLFFLWGAITSVIDVLVAAYKKIYTLSEVESLYPMFAFFGAYGVGSLIYYLYSQQKGDPINRIGYKKGMLYGLIIAGIGCVSLYPLTALNNYYAVIFPFFVIGLGLTLLQITCNPYVAILGNQNSASTRLNLSQGFNSLGTTVGPLVGGFLILNFASKEIAIQNLFLFSGIILFTIAGLLVTVELPEYRSDENEKLKDSAFKFSHLRLGMLAIFFYVGAEVFIGAKLIGYLGLPEIAGMNATTGSSYLGLYWGGAMIGRLTISILASDKFKLAKRIVYGLIVAFASFAFLIFAITVKTKVMELHQPFNGETLLATFKDLSPFLIFITIQFVLMILFRESSKKLLSVFAGLVIVFLVIAFLTGGNIAMWCILSIGLFNSIMWSNIFTLSISGLKEYTSQGSSLLIIMIVGGAILPLFLGWVSDLSGIRLGYLFPIISYLYILFFGLYGSRTKQIYE